MIDSELTRIRFSDGDGWVMLLSSPELELWQLAVYEDEGKRLAEPFYAPPAAFVRVAQMETITIPGRVFWLALEPGESQVFLRIYRQDARDLKQPEVMHAIPMDLYRKQCSLLS